MYSNVISIQHLNNYQQQITLSCVFFECGLYSKAACIIEEIPFKSCNLKAVCFNSRYQQPNAQKIKPNSKAKYLSENMILRMFFLSTNFSHISRNTLRTGSEVEARGNGKVDFFNNNDYTENISTSLITLCWL